MKGLDGWTCFLRLASQNEAAPEGIRNHPARHQKLSYTFGVGAKTLQVKPDLLFQWSYLSQYAVGLSGPLEPGEDDQPASWD